MKAWSKSLDPSGKSGVRLKKLPHPQLQLPKEEKADSPQIRFLADPSLSFTKALDLSFDGRAIFGGDRSKRYALVVDEHGTVEEAHVEKDNTGLDGEFSLIPSVLDSNNVFLYPFSLSSGQSSQRKMKKKMRRESSVLPISHNSLNRE